jgi:hypothetical protein
MFAMANTCLSTLLRFLMAGLVASPWLCMTLEAVTGFFLAGDGIPVDPVCPLPLRAAHLHWSSLDAADPGSGA